MVWQELPPELWTVVGDYIFSDLLETADGSIDVQLKPARFYELTWDDSIAFVSPSDCLLT